MNLLIYEHISGGGCIEGKIPLSTLSEGYAMLRALASDFKASGYNVITLLDARVNAFNPPLEAERVISISSQKGLKKTLEETFQIVDAVYIIAPETNRTLQNLVEMAESSGGTSLNCRPAAIEAASDKTTVYKILNRKGIRVPDTREVDAGDSLTQIKHAISNLGFPMVFKPLDGAGCSGLSLIEKESQISVAVKKMIRESSSQHFIAQKLIRGVPASVSLNSNGDEAVPITLNAQKVTLASPSSDSSYDGGTVPLHHPTETEAFEVAQRAVEALTGLRGYVGVDMVLTEEGPVVMEINPRLTTSYIGVRKVVNFNPAEAITNAVLERKLPKGTQTSGYVSFLKVTLRTTPLAISKTFRLKEVSSPPFPTTEDGTACAMLISQSAKLRGAEMKLAKAKKNLFRTLSEGD